MAHYLYQEENFQKESEQLASFYWDLIRRFICLIINQKREGPGE
jgi:hypothetical protein